MKAADVSTNRNVTDFWGEKPPVGTLRIGPADLTDFLYTKRGTPRLVTSEIINYSKPSLVCEHANQCSKDIIRRFFWLRQIFVNAVFHTILWRTRFLFETRTFRRQNSLNAFRLWSWRFYFFSSQFCLTSSVDKPGIKFFLYPIQIA